MISTKKITRTASFIAAAVLLGYVESLFPPIAAGVKLGLSNMVVLTVLYVWDTKTAWSVSLLKVILCMALFGSVTSFVYSLCGAVVSLLFMVIAKNSRLFSIAAVSGIGGLCHNLAQLLCAYFIIGSGVLFYLPVLCFSGIVCGVITGIGAGAIIKRGDLFGKE